ncbi:MAG: hypothetical protein ACO2Z9_10650 [Crocinitomicaceae bacterium]
MRSILFLLLLTPFVAGAQLKGAVLKLEGTWTFKESPGFEKWERAGEEMVGRAYRVNKMGDTSLVEEMHISSVNNRLVYQSITFNRPADTVIRVAHNFVGKRRKMMFTNIARDLPYAIKYNFGFLNKRKLNIQIHFHEGEKAKKMVLRKKE